MTTLARPSTACYYSGNENMPDCKQLGGTCIRMTGKRASPKERNCCFVCAQWLVAESLGNVVVVQAVSEGEEDAASLEEAEMTTSRGLVCFYSGAAACVLLVYMYISTGLQFSYIVVPQNRDRLGIAHAGV